MIVLANTFVRESAYTASAGAPKEQPPRNLSGKRTVQKWRYWKLRVG